MISNCPQSLFLRLPLLLLLALALPAASSPAAAAGEGPSITAPPGDETGAPWPRWREPSGQGMVQDGGYPDEWDAEKNVLWRTPVPGSGNSSPVVWGGRIFLTASYDEGRRRSVLCFDRASGEPLWEVFAPIEADPEKAHKNGWASPIIIDTGEREELIVSSQHRVTACDPATGEELFFTRNSGETFVLRAGPEFELLRTNELGEAVLASPALLDGRWCIRTEGDLLCVGIR